MVRRRSATVASISGSAGFKTASCPDNTGPRRHSKWVLGSAGSYYYSLIAYHFSRDSVYFSTKFFYGLGAAALFIQLGGEANKAEGQKLMTEVPELRQRIADKSISLEKLAKHGNARRREGDFFFLPWNSRTSFTQSRAHHTR